MGACRVNVGRGWVSATAALLLAAGCYSFALPDAADGGADAGPAEAGPPTDAGRDADAGARCIEGGYYCGGEKLAGASDTLYRCNADGRGTLVAKCANGCAVGAPGKDDTCRPPTPCTAGGTYCGGDKVNGEPDVLYRCNADQTISVVKRCTSGCQVNAGTDDTCR